MFTPAIGLSTYVWNNNWRSVLLLAGFPVLLALLAFGVAVIFAAGSASLGEAFRAAWRNLPAFLGAAALVAALWFAVAFTLHQRILDWVAGAHPVTRETERRLWDLMETLCISRGETIPRLGVIETPALNAFASGLSRRAGAVTVTRGLLDGLDDREVSAVLAHELAHIRNGDARLAVIAAVFSGVITLGFDVMRGARGAAPTGGMRWPMPRLPRSDRRGGGPAILIIIVGIVIVALAGVLSVALRLALSRNREYLADAGAVAITGDADAMASALRRIEGRSAMAVPGQVEAMLIEHAAGARGPSLWATHPPIGARVDALVRYAGARDPGPAAAPPPPPAAAPGGNALREEVAAMRARREGGA